MRMKKIPDTPLQRWLYQNHACWRARRQYGKLTLAQAITKADYCDLYWLAVRLMYLRKDENGVQVATRGCEWPVPDFPPGRWAKQHLLGWMIANGAQLPLGL